MSANNINNLFIHSEENNKKGREENIFIKNDQTSIISDKNAVYSIRVKLITFILKTVWIFLLSAFKIFPNNHAAVCFGHVDLLN